MLEDWEQGGRSSLGRMFAHLNKPAEHINAQSLSEIADYWRTNGEKEIDRIDRENRRRASTKKIEGSARLDLRNKIAQAVAHADLWLSLTNERPDKRAPFPSEQAKLLRNAVNDHADQAVAEIHAAATAFEGSATKLLRRYAGFFTATEMEG